jgi:hypothetical protein
MMVHSEMSESALATRLGKLTKDADEMIQQAYDRQHHEKVWEGLTPAEQEAFWHSQITYGRW